MATVNQWTAKIEELAGLPFVHQGRNRVGVDCYGLLVLAADELGIGTPELHRVTGYRRLPGKRLIDDTIGNFLVKRPYNRLQPLRGQIQLGDIIVFHIDDRTAPRHLGVYTSDQDGYAYMTHADGQLRKVVRHRLTATSWQRRIRSVWYYPDFEDN